MRPSRLRLYAAFVVMSVGLPGSGLSAQDITPPDVDLLVRTIAQELEVLRWHMGRPAEVRAPIPVEDVAIRENFRQAMTLWQKVNQLGIEVVGGGEAPPIVRPPRGGSYGPEHVHAVLGGAMERLQEIREGVGIVGAVGTLEPASELEVDPSATPSDVYQQVQQAVFYASEILAAGGDDNPFPSVPEYQPGLTPSHVYGRLLSVFDRLEQVFIEVDEEMVNWQGEAYFVSESLTPSDVFDLATLLLSELEHLHAGVQGARVPLQAVHPGQRWPSNVYQQAGVLLEQAARIMALANGNPGIFSFPGN
jgi:hypothetical protein